MKRRSLKFLLLIFIALGIVNCETQDDIFSEQIIENDLQTNIQVTRVTINSLSQNKSMQSILKKMSSSLDINKTNKTNSKIDSNDGSFTILTDLIKETSTDSTLTYTFIIETPTQETSAFENFVLVRNNDDSYGTFIFRYQTDDAQEDFSYNLEIEELPESLINIEDFQDFTNSNKTVKITGLNGCEYTFVEVCSCSDCENPDVECELVFQQMNCPSGGGSGSPIDDTNNDPFNNGPGNFDPNDTTGGNTNFNGINFNYPAAVSVPSWETIKKNILLCTSIPNENDEFTGWVKHNIEQAQGINDFLVQNGCSDQSAMIVTEVYAIFIENIELTMEEALERFYDENPEVFMATFQYDVGNEDYPIENMEEYLSCFNDGKTVLTYDFKLYVDQPIAGQNTVVTAKPQDVGHTFFSLI